MGTKSSEMRAVRDANVDELAPDCRRRKQSRWATSPPALISRVGARYMRARKTGPDLPAKEEGSPLAGATTGSCCL